MQLGCGYFVVDYCREIHSAIRWLHFSGSSYISRGFDSESGELLLEETALVVRKNVRACVTVAKHLLRTQSLLN